MVAADCIMVHELYVQKLSEHEFHSLYSETHWFEWSAFVVSGTDIPNANPEVHIQHVAENLTKSVIALNTFHVMEMITTVPPGGKILTQVPRKIMSLQDIEAVSRVNVKYLNGMYIVLHFRN